jgi:hypothetical protein
VVLIKVLWWTVDSLCLLCKSRRLLCSATIIHLCMRIRSKGALKKRQQASIQTPDGTVKLNKGKRADGPVQATVAERIKATCDRLQAALRIETKERT